ncbi:hypothetical protein NMY22_g3312 [Coprinellus aureogranulatus]|nr:hypothetical protein NMY22_g3312 [Coprinellus aureogranulatus]
MPRTSGNGTLNFELRPGFIKGQVKDPYSDANGVVCTHRIRALNCGARIIIVDVSRECFDLEVILSHGNVTPAPFQHDQYLQTPTAPRVEESGTELNTLAAAIPEVVETREISQVEDDAIFQRGFVEGLVGRELSDAEYDLVTREPGFGKFLKGAFKVGKSFLGFRRDLSEAEELDARDFEELIEREPGFGKFLKGAFKVGKSFLGFRRDFEDIDELEARELEELIEREPGFGKFLKGAFKVGKSFLGFRRDLDVDELDARELAELVEREPGFGKFLKGAFKVGKSFLGFRRDIDIDELESRELAELAVREPGFGKFLKGAFKVGKSFLGFRRDVDLDELDAREFEDIEELDAREFEEALLEERDPLIGLGFRLAKGAAKFAVKGASRLFGREEFDGDLVERDLDYEDALFEREYEVDELD